MLAFFESGVFLWCLVPIAVMVIVIVVIASLAPEGYEDDKGFHYGKQ